MTKANQLKPFILTDDHPPVPTSIIAEHPDFMYTDELPHCTIKNAEAYDACQRYLKAATNYFRKAQELPDFGISWTLWYAENSIDAGVLCWDGHLLIRYVEEQGWDDREYDDQDDDDRPLTDCIYDLIRAVAAEDEVSPYDIGRWKRAINAVCEIQMRIAAHRYMKTYNPPEPNGRNDDSTSSLQKRCWTYLNDVPEAERQNVTSRQLAEVLGCAHGAISNLNAWKEEMHRRQQTGIQSRGRRAKLQRLTAAMQIGKEDPNLAALLADEKSDTNGKRHRTAQAPASSNVT